MNLLDNFQVVRHSEFAILPEFVFPLAMGYDIFSSETYIIPPGRRAFIDTGISVTIPNGMYATLAPRMSLKTIGVDTVPVMYDPFSIHRVRVLLINNTPHELPIQAGDKIAVMVLLPMDQPTLVNITQELLDECDVGSDE